MNRKEARKLVEITCVAGVLFAVPGGYFYYREQIVQKWNSTYNRYIRSNPVPILFVYCCFIIILCSLEMKEWNLSRKHENLNYDFKRRLSAT